MQKLDELVEATLQEKDRERRSEPQSEVRRTRRAPIPYLILGLMGLCLLSLLVVWAFHSAGP
jgi:hypothetical protein